MRFALSATIALSLVIAGTSFMTANTSAAAAGCAPRPPDTTMRIIRPRWISQAVVTEYYPVRERWFAGRVASAPGLSTRHRLDWLYGPRGVAMNGEGLGNDGRFYRFAGPYDVGWINQAGQSTVGCWNGRWTHGQPAWLDVGWRNRVGQVTYPLAVGGWSNGIGRRYVRPPRALRFTLGRALSLPFWKTVAVDPEVVPLGSRVFIPAYCDTPAHGWFRALDTGGAIIGYHFDVYRAPPETLVLRSFRGQRVFVLPPGSRLPRATSAHCPH